MRIIVVGPGRAGGSLAVAARRAGHDVVAVYARRSDDRDVAGYLGLGTRLLGDPLPDADLIVVAVRDDSIGRTARAISRGPVPVPRAVHLSGLAPLEALDALRDIGLQVGSFHPLQTLPDWRTGSRSLAGSFIGITAQDDLSQFLERFAGSLGCRPFRIAEEKKSLYHAAASAASNYVTTALALAETLYSAAGLELRVARPLVRQAVANAFDLGAVPSLTGPITRGDTGTVRTQLEAVDLHAPDLSESFRAFARATAGLIGTTELMEDLLA